MDEKQVEKNHQFRRMILLSAFGHVALVALLVLGYWWQPVVEVSLLTEPHAQEVQLVDSTELPDLPVPPDQPPPVEPRPQSEDRVAFQEISALAQMPTVTPTLLPKPTAHPTVTPHPTAMPTPRRLPTPTVTPRIRRTPIPTPTPRPKFRRTPTVTPMPQPEEPIDDDPVLAFDIPRRQAAISPGEIPREKLPGISERLRESQQAGQGRRPLSTEFSDHGNGGTAVSVEQADDFPYPEYLTHIQQKIEGLWFPEGAGTVSLYVVIGRDGKILQSGVDKGEGVGVEKLKESVIRAIMLIKRFDALPRAYRGMELRVRIAVRR